ncbi:MAG: hypothetical protein MAG453_02097 [Calditrichaeota bacterium]|nr:hypothetical protein [Calditrichota bacterium]
MDLLALALLWPLLGILLTVLVALSRDLRPGLWGVLGFLFGPLAALFAAVSPRPQPAPPADPESAAEIEPAPPPDPAQDDRPRTPCPHCAELVLIDARVCRFCGREISPAPDTGAAEPAGDETP